MSEFTDLIKEEEIEKALKLTKEKEGFSVDFKKGTTIVESRKDNTGLALIRLKCVIKNSDPETCFEMLDDIDFIHEYDHMCEKWSIVQSFEGGRDVSWYVSKKPFVLVSARDFVTTRIKKVYDDSRYLLLNRNTEHPKAPPIKGVVRGYVYHTIFYFEKHGENDSLCVYLTKSDLKGYIPKWGINWLTKTTAPKMLATVEKSIPKYMEYLKKKKEEESCVSL